MVNLSPSRLLSSVSFRAERASAQSRNPRLSSQGARSVRLASGRNSGFTLIELMIVMVIIGLLAAIAVPMYVQSVRHAKEAVLKEDLRTLRSAIDSYTVDKQKAPQTL